MVKVLNKGGILVLHFFRCSANLHGRNIFLWLLRTPVGLMISEVCQLYLLQVDYILLIIKADLLAANVS